MDGLEGVGRGGDAGGGGLKELLVAVVDEAGDFATQDPAGRGDPDDGVLLAVGRGLGSVFRVRGEDGGGAVFAYGHLVCDSGELADIKLLIAKDLKHLFEAADDDFGAHGGLRSSGRCRTGAALTLLKGEGAAGPDRVFSVSHIGYAVFTTTMSLS